MLIERLKEMIAKVKLPAETRAALAEAKSASDMAKRLDERITANEVEFRALQKEIEHLESEERREVEKIKSGELGRRSKNAGLMRIQRLRLQQDSLEARMRIHDNNMQLHIALLGKIQSLDAMEMRGLEEREIDSVSLEFEEEYDKYAAAMEAGTDALTTALPDQAERDAKLAELEAEILGEPADAPPEAAAESPEGASGGRREEADTPDRDAAKRREDGRDKEAAWD